METMSQPKEQAVDAEAAEQATRTIEVRVGDIAARYALLNDATRTAEALWASLPIEGSLTHARWAGSAVWVETAAEPLATLGEIELPVTSIYPGTMVVRPHDSGHAELLFSYGSAESRGPVGRTYATPIAEIDGDSEPLFATFAETWRGGSATVLITRAEG